MKVFATIQLLVGTLVGALPTAVDAQGTFRNLDFESATVPPLPAGQRGSLYGTAASAAIPYWTADLGPYLGTAPPAGITYNGFTLGSANISLLGPNWDASFGLPIIQGNYTLLLQAGDSPGPVSVSIAQTGVIPAGTRSIQMWISPFSGTYYPAVTVGGQNIPLYALAQGANLAVLMGGDISAFAGQTQELRISSLTSASYPFGSFMLDNIVFSPTSVPEPRTLALGLCAAALLGSLCWRRRK